MIATYHNHTSWSDGKATLVQNLIAARQLGVDELGISDHLTLHPSGVTPEWSMLPADLPAYVQELQSVTKNDLPRVRLGIEVDWFASQADAIRQALRDHPFDYVIGSVHYVGRIVIDSSAEAWQKLTPDQREQVHRNYWHEVTRMAESGLFDIAAHLDLTKKFAFLARSDLSLQIGTALDAIAAAKIVVELNTAGWHKPCADAYPTLQILRECRKRDIAVTLSADSHQPDHLVRDFARGAQRLIEAGYSQVARFRARQMHLEPIESALP